MLLGNLAEREGFARAGARIQNFDLAFFPLDRVEQAFEVVEICRVAAYAGHVPTDQPDGFVQRPLPASCYENVGPFFNEHPGASPRHAACSTRDDGHQIERASCWERMWQN